MAQNDHVTEGQFIEYINEAANQLNNMNSKVDNIQKITAFNWKGNKDTYADLLLLTDLEVNDGYSVIADGLVYVWNGTAFPPEGQGMNLGLKPDENSKVEEGNTQAVSGGEVFEKLQKTKIHKWTAQPYTAGQQVLDNDIWYEAVVDTTAMQEPGVVAETIWKRVINTESKKVVSDVVLTFEQGGTNISGGIYDSTVEIRSIESPKFNIGDTVNIRINNGYSYYVKQRDRLPASGDSRNPDSFSTTPRTIDITASNVYMRVIIRKVSGEDITPADAHGFEMELTENKKFLIDTDIQFLIDTDIQPLIAEKADKVSFISETKTRTDYEWVNKSTFGTQPPTDSLTKVRMSQDLFFKAPTQIVITRDNPTYFLHVKRGLTSPVTGSNINASNPATINVAAGEYINVEIARRDGADLPITEDTGFQLVINKTLTTTNERYVDEKATDLKVEFDEQIKGLDEQIKGLPTPILSYTPNFRSPDLATGGVFSFIDDDGKVGVESTLYNLFKAKEVPFGIAIITGSVGDTGYITMPQLKELYNDFQTIEVLSHSVNHLNMSGLTDAQQDFEVRMALDWFYKNGIETHGFVLPYGGNNAMTRNIVAKYHPICYDFQGNVINYINTIRNSIVQRFSLGLNFNLESWKGFIDTTCENNGWMIITTHVNNSGYWDETTLQNLSDVIDYIKTKPGAKILKPKDGYHIFGNLIESGNGFRITSEGQSING